MAIFALTTTTIQPITLPLAHAHGVIVHNNIVIPFTHTLTIITCQKCINLFYTYSIIICKEVYILLWSLFFVKLQGSITLNQSCERRPMGGVVHLAYLPLRQG